MRVLLVDHQDSFVHTLAGYFAEQGADVSTLRAGFDLACWTSSRPTWSCCRRGPAVRPTSTATSC